MSDKVLWDYAYYWAIPCNFFFHGRLTNLHVFAGLRDELAAAAELNVEMQALFRDWHPALPAHFTPGYVNVPELPFMEGLNAGLMEEIDEDEDFKARLLEDIGLLRQIAAEILAEAQENRADLSLSGVEARPGELLSKVWAAHQGVKMKG